MEKTKTIGLNYSQAAALMVLTTAELGKAKDVELPDLFTHTLKGIRSMAKLVIDDFDREREDDEEFEKRSK